MVAKIQFSEAEAELMRDASVILTKNRVIDKIRSVFDNVQLRMVEEVSDFAMKGSAFDVPPKISRGENYLGLPYVVLDYPRHFSNKDVFAIRSLFWWGHFFSSTLQLSGIHKEKFMENIRSAYSALSHAGYYIGISEEAWVHQIEGPHYAKISHLQEEEFLHYCASMEHVKIVTWWPLHELPVIEERLMGSWRYLLEGCFHQFPKR